MPKCNEWSFKIGTLCVALMIAGCALGGNTASAEAETWTGTWNAPNLWRSVDLTFARGSTGEATLAVGTAREKVTAIAHPFTIGDTSMHAEMDYAGTTIQMDGHVEAGTAEGRLTVTRGDSVLARGRWTLARVDPSDLTAETILKRVRRALHLPGPLAAGFTIEQSTGADSGASDPPEWSAHVGPGDALAVSEEGTPSLLFDGAQVQVTRGPFGWMSADVRLQEKLLLAEVIRSGAWIAEKTTLRFRASTMGTGSNRRYVIEITTPTGVVPAHVTIDPETWLPEGASVAWDAGAQSVRFGDYREYAGARFPSKITVAYRGREQEWLTTRVAPGGETFKVVAAEHPHYERNASPVLEGTHGAGNDGHLFVRPRVAGRDIGWFHIDTGAPFMILDTQVADELGLEVIRNMGARSIRKLPEIQIGQLVLREQLVFVVDLSSFSAPDSSRRAGVIGTPVFQHGVVVFDYDAVRLSVFAPDAFDLPVGSWQSLFLAGGPVIEASVDGNREHFLIDTGKSGSASFSSHAAARLGFFDGRDLTESENLTVEGTTLELRTHIDAFTFGGRRFTGPEVWVKLPGTTNDDIGTAAGFMGRPFFQNRRVVFDYAGGRIGFLE